MFHWTDPKTHVHVCYSVLALAVAYLVRREAHHAGMDLSARELLAALGAQNTRFSTRTASCLPTASRVTSLSFTLLARSSSTLTACRAAWPPGRVAAAGVFSPSDTPAW